MRIKPRSKRRERWNRAGRETPQEMTVGGSKKARQGQSTEGGGACRLLEGLFRDGPHDSVVTAENSTMAKAMDERTRD